MGDWANRIRAQLAQVVDDGRWRAPRTFDAQGPAGLLEEPVGGPSAPELLGTAGRSPVVSFASNDYLGLSAHPSVVAAAKAALDRWATLSC